MATRIPVALTTGTDFTEMQLGDTCLIPGNLTVNGTITAAAQAALTHWGGPNSPNAASAAPQFNAYDSCAIFGGASNIRPLPTALVPAPTITHGGTAGTTTYAYAISAVMPDSVTYTAATNIGTNSTGNATLSGTNTNVLTWTATAGAALYAIYRTTGGATQGLIGTTTSLTFTDTGLTATTATPQATVLTGEYWHSGSWTQFSPVACFYVRLHIGGAIIFNNTFQAITECAGGLGAGAGSAGDFANGGNGAGLGAGECNSTGSTLTGGGGGGFGGAGGNGGVSTAGYKTVNAGGTYPLAICLSGSGGGGGSATANGGGNGGNGGGGIYIECRSTVNFNSGANIIVSGNAGTTGANNTGGGGGSGGAFQLRAWGAVAIASGASILATGGAGGAGSGTTGPGGGGGGGGIIDISGLTISNSGTVTAGGGAAGAGGATGYLATAGSAGLVNLLQFIQSVRAA